MRACAVATVIATAVVVSEAAAAESPLSSTASDRARLAVTVYNDDFSVVRDERWIRLPEGACQLRFMDVAREIEPASLRVDVIEGAPLSVLELNYEYDLLEPKRLLDLSVGRELWIEPERRAKGSTRPERTAATLLAASQGTVWQVDGRIVVERRPSQVSFPELPPDLLPSPTLVWGVFAQGAGQRRVGASYLTAGLGWHAEYVLTLDTAAHTGAFQGWATIANESGASYEDARVQLVAGEVHRAEPESGMELLALGAFQESVTVSATEEPLFEYHLYTLPRPTTIRSESSKQVELLRAPALRVRRDYELRSEETGFHENLRGGAPAREKVGVVLAFRNDAASGLGMPLPAGAVRVYTRDLSGSPQLVGDDTLEHTPEDEEVRLRLGYAFDLAAERRQTEYQALSGSWESAWEIRLRNHKPEPVTVLVVEPLAGDWAIVQSSHPYRKTAASEAAFEVAVAAGAEAVVRYRVRVR